MHPLSKTPADDADNEPAFVCVAAVAAETPGRGRVRQSAADESGVVAIEFALVLPIILLFLFTIVDFGQVFNHVNDVNQIAANGARLAAVDSNPGDPATLQEYLKNQADLQGLKDNIGVCVAFPTGTSNVGDPVEVRVTSTYVFLPLLADLVGAAPVDIHGEATMRIERPPAGAAYSEGGDCAP